MIDEPIRQPRREPPAFLSDAMRDDFAAPLDVWLADLGFSPSQLAGVPFSENPSGIASMSRDELLDPLRAVQKPEGLAEFEEKQCASYVSPPFAAESDRRDPSSGHNKEPEGQTKNMNKRPEDRRNSERPLGKLFAFVLSTWPLLQKK